LSHERFRHRLQLLQHADRKLAETYKEAELMAKEARELAAWAADKTEQIDRLTADARKLNGADGSATAAAEELVGKVEKLLSEKEKHKKRKDELVEQHKTLVAKMKGIENETFKHGPSKTKRLTVAPKAAEDESGAEPPPRSADEMSGMLDEMLAKWADLENAEKNFHAAIDEVLTEKRTDAMLDEVEKMAREIADTAEARKRRFLGWRLEATCSMVDLQATIEALDVWTADTKVAMQQVEKLRKLLYEVQKRRKNEKRDPPPTLEYYESIYIPALENSSAAASQKRRQLGAAITEQVRVINTMTDAWKKVAGPLNNALPADPTFPKPPMPNGDACVIC